jgi:hypothetical protein
VFNAEKKSAASFGVGNNKSRSSIRNPDASKSLARPGWKGEERVEDRLLPMDERRCENGCKK